jgi:large repetitive protein
MQRMPRFRVFLAMLGVAIILLQAGSVLASPTARGKNDVILPQNWEETGPMHASRVDFTLSLLPDGKALAAGGSYDDGTPHYLNTSESYDMLTGVWSLAGNMNTPRARHTATVLLDGRVLVAGGINGIGPQSSADIFDPVSRTWSPTGDMGHARFSHTATRLNDGRVLVVGGCQSFSCLTSAEIYDPATGLWQSAANLPAGARKDHTAVLLQDGSVLVSGGVNPGSPATYFKTAYRYNPGINTWSAAGSMIEYRAQHTAVLQRNGKVMVAGGEGTPPLGTRSYPMVTEAYDPVANSWAKLKNTSNEDIMIDYGRAQALGVLDPYGSFYLFGGFDGTAAGSVQYRSLNNDTDVWYPHGSLSRPRYGAAAVQLSNGAILLAGGKGVSGSLADAEINHPREGSTELDTGTGILGTVYSSGTLMPNGDILFTGGANDVDSGTGKPCHKTAYLWLEEEAIDALAPMHWERCFHTTTLLPDGRVVVIGGTVATGGSAAGAAEILSGGVWTSLGGPSFTGPETALLPNGEILIIDPSTRPHGYLFNPKNLTFRQTVGDYTGTYSSFTLTLMNNGKALILGSSGSDVIEVYDPQTETFSVVSALSDRRVAHTATLMPDGKVLIAGGRYGSGPNQGKPISATYLFNPNVTPPTNPWTILDVLNQPRYNHSAVLLPDGRVAVLGGQLGATGDTIDAVELYNPAENMWRVVGTLLVERASHKTILSSKGKLVTFGGYGDGYSARITVEQFLFSNVSTSGLFWRPTVTDTVCLNCPSGKQIDVTGSGFTSPPEGTNGGSAQSPANTPLVQIMRLDNQQVLWLNPGAASSDTHFRSAPIPDFPFGPVMVYVFSKGSVQGKVLLLSDYAHKVYVPLVMR